MFFPTQQLAKKLTVRRVAGLLALVAFGSGFALHTHAQIGAPNETLSQNLMQEGVIVSISPRVPSPNQTARITLTSYRHDLKKAFIAWYRDGELVQADRGLATYDFVTGASGSQERISFIVETATGLQVSEEITVRPAIVTIHWEALTYTPALYRGRSLYTPQSTLRFVALPEFVTTNGTMLPPEELVYTWKKGAYPIPGTSGYGKQSIEVPGDLFDGNTEITVEVESLDGTYKGSHTIEVPKRSPQILLYEFHPLLGVRYAHAIDSEYALREDEVALLAEPFNFEGARRETPEMTYAWNVDRQPISARSLLTLRRPEEEGEAQARISLTLSRTDRLLQRVFTQVHITF